jgi:hypothetical protein
VLLVVLPVDAAVPVLLKVSPLGQRIEHSSRVIMIVQWASENAELSCAYRVLEAECVSQNIVLRHSWSALDLL